MTTLTVLVGGSELHLDFDADSDAYLSGPWRIACRSPDTVSKDRQWKATKTIEVEGGSISVTRYGEEAQDCVDKIQEFVDKIEVP